MTFSFAILLLAAAVSDNSTAPETTAVAETPAPVEAAPKKPKKICKSMNMTGSMVGKRACKTKEQWEQSESAMELGQKSARGS